MKYNKPFNENASKQRWHGLANSARPLTERQSTHEISILYIYTITN
jgi:hypothetical protein